MIMGTFLFGILIGGIVLYVLHDVMFAIVCTALAAAMYLVAVNILIHTLADNECSVCGHKLEDDENYCSMCGTHRMW